MTQTSRIPRTLYRPALGTALLALLLSLLVACGTTAPVDTVTDVSVTPAEAEIGVGGEVLLTATVETTGDATGELAWSVEPEAGANLVPDGDEAVFSATTTGTYTVTATSVENESVSATSVITVTDAEPAVTGVSVTPANDTIEVGESIDLTAAVATTGGAGTDVTWSVDPTTGTTLTPDGATATFSSTTPGTYTITATSVDDPAVSDTSVINVVDPTAPAAVESVTVNPSTVSAAVNEAVSLSAVVVVSGAASDAVTWSVEPATGANLDVGGGTVTFTGTQAGTYVVTATSDEDPTVSDSSTITVTGEAGPVRINAGAESGYETIDGRTFSQNLFSTGGGGGFTRTDSPEIAGTDDDPIYWSELWGSSFSYDVPVANGTYDVTLHFAEIFLEQDQVVENFRVFDVTAEGTLQLDDYNPITAAGGLVETAATESFQVTVTDGVLNLEFETTDASVDNAKVNAIEIVPATP